LAQALPYEFDMKTTLVIILALITTTSWAFSFRFNTSGGNADVAKSAPEEWKDLLNPKTNRFWKEGNHVPDEGFLLLAKNPTNKAYAKYWLLRNEIKAEQLTIIQATVDEAQRELFLEGKLKDRYYQFGKGNRVTTKKTSLPLNQTPNLSKTDLKKLNYYFIFSSTCPHCSELAKKIKNLPDVRPLQADQKGIKHFAGLIQSSRATPETLSNYAPDGVVPVVVIHNPKTNAATKIVGNKSLEDYLAASAQILKE
jgi:hypothetical protein